MKTYNLYSRKEDCCGCWACYSVCSQNAITMEEDNEGFKYPQINEEKCVDCKLCLKVCPVKSSSKRLRDIEEQPHIGIINLQYTQNYGAVIAAAVLEDVIRRIVKNKYIVENIKLAPYCQFKYRYEYVLDRVHSLGGWKFYFEEKFSKKISTADNKLRTQRFDIFRDTFINESKVYQNAQQIKDSKINYAAFVTGSDIVWAPKKVDNFRADIHFLKFRNKQQTTIAYAPSIDSVVNNKLKRNAVYYKNGLRYIDYISVREKSNVDFIQSLTDKKVYECCDPAFLVEPNYYKKMIDIAQMENDGQKYIYVYILEENQNIVDYANKLARKKNLKICYYSKFHKSYDVNSEDCTADGPAEFLYRIKNAEYVLTNSFHCIVFSLLFQKKFLSFSRNKSSIKSSDLLEKFDLSDRIVDNNRFDIDTEIDFENVNNVIKEMRSYSMKFLTDALSDFI